MGRSLLALAALLFVASSCFDEIPDATQGFLEIETGDVSGAEVFVDDVPQGATSRVGPLEAGTYVVRVGKQYYDVVPSEREIVVRPTETARAGFTMTLVAAGAVRVTAKDELLGDDVAGAEIFRLDDAGTPQPTGAVTPATIDRLPPGPVRFILRKDGFGDTAPISVDVRPFETADVETELAPPRAVLIEMFTFTSCAGCPESADELRGLYHDNPGRFFAVEWHSQAPFPLFDARWRTREVFYRGSFEVAKPAVVVQGGAGDVPPVLLGSAASELALYHARFEMQRDRCSNECPVALKAVGTVDATSASFTVHAKWRGGALPSGLTLRTVLLEHLIIAPGTDPPYDFVPRDLYETAVNFSTPGQILEFPEVFAIQPGWSADNMDVVTYIQSDDTHEIFAVTGTRRVTSLPGN